MIKKVIFYLVIFFVAVLSFNYMKKYESAYLFHKGYAYYNQKDYVQSYTYLKKAYHLNRTNKDYKYYYTKTLTHLSPTVSVQKEVYEIANNEQDSAQQVAEKQIRDWRFYALKNIGDNYIEQVPLDSKILRWNTSKFPLKVSITTESDLKIPDYYKIEIQKAFLQWQSSVDILKFALSDKNPDIAVNIQKTPNNLCSEGICNYTVGYTIPKYNGKILKRMDITLYSNLPDGKFFSDKEIYGTILHEIGHALGIMGHSYSSEDLMYMTRSDTNNLYLPYKSSFQYLSSKDINTIKLLYKLVPDITNSENVDTNGLIYAPIILGNDNIIRDRELKEALYYIKKAPDMPEGYIKLGAIYADMNKPKDAINSFQKAYNLAKSNIDKYNSMYNMALVYFELKDYEKAVDSAITAKKIDDNDEIDDLLNEIYFNMNSKK